jgi:hypothetical protein
MKSLHLLLALIVVPVMIFAQATTQKAEIKWIERSASASDSLFSLYFEGMRNYGSTGLIPYYYAEIDMPLHQSLAELHIANVLEMSFAFPKNVYDDLLVDLKDDYKPVYQVKLKDGRKFAQVYVPCIVQNPLPGYINRMQSFDLEYTLEDSDFDTEKSLNANHFAANSALQSGSWYQFKLTESGIYKITYDQASAAGMNFSGISSQKIKVYGFGEMLPESNNELMFPDIPEVAIKMMDGGDGSFDAGDYILFYAQGSDSWKYSTSNHVFEHNINVYSRESFYYMVISEGNGRRIQTISNSQTANFTANTFVDFDVVEDEKYNLINSGRRWFGDKYEFTTEYQYPFNFDNIATGSDVFVNALFAARSTTSSRFTIEAFGESKSVSIGSIPSGSYPSYAINGEIKHSFTPATTPSSFNIKINYNQPTSSSAGWLDYIEVIVLRNLVFNGSQMTFRNPATVAEGRVTEFVMQSESGQNAEVWDITNFTNPVLVSTSVQGNSISFKSATTELREFMAFDEADALRTEFVKTIGNQNLHGDSNYDYIIITHPDFMEQANELADFHSETSHLDVYVTTLESIYHEFSSGRQDVSAIRDYMRCAWENSNKKLKYLLLFGDASMDYLNRVENNTNMIPTWEDVESLNPITSLATDDFFGYLDENEGDLSFDEIDLGIGRFPVVTAAEAQEMVNKVKHYKGTAEGVKADWLNSICLIADDEDSNLHISDADELSVLVDSIYPAANLDKIYVDAYAQESTPAGQRYPKANEAINEKIDRGALIISYTGHGGEVGWGQERFLDVPDIQSWTNYKHLPVFLTATCEFARYDDPNRVSAGELIFLNEDGGGVALFTTSRATYAGSNMVVSTNFYKIALTREQDGYPTLGELLKKTKLASGGSDNVRKFVLLGDPAMKMNMPENKVRITSIINNGTQLETDTLKALSNITISGDIVDANNNPMSQFNGYVYPSIYDKPTIVSTLANDAASKIFDFELQKNIIYKGKADVVNGHFEFTFIVPRDIAYNYGKGKISFYAENGHTDAKGYDREIIIGGYDDYSTTDESGPAIRLYVNQINFINGGITNENPVLLAYVTDDNGINTTGNGIGHDISATLDGDPNSVKILNDYYVADANSYKSGAIQFPFFNLEDGAHSIELKVWDIHNNSSKASIDFVVVSGDEMTMENLFNYPNPVTDYTIFSFEHNQAKENMDVSIDIYSIDGKLVTRLEESFLADSYRSNEIRWEVTDEYGNRLMKGIYIYRVTIKTESGNETYKANRMVVIK